ncbi:MAG: MaoC family dehydratase N-terminal domain-containing protein [Deltaproteobacteria bacterium]|nr:MaoC family dehydratase N-terminal domain-containing protein [Deltaproteobacteria bacterium]
MKEFDWNQASRETRRHVFHYTWKDVVLYALGIGARIDELPFIYENAADGLQVFPSFAAIAAGGLIRDFAEKVEGNRFLHGEQMVRLHHPIPPQGTIITTGRVADVFDKGKAAVIRFESEGHTEEGTHLFDVEHIAFHVGGGGFGGNPGPKADSLIPPEGIKPDFSISYNIPENQAALYRLSGDLNFLHLDPEYAKQGGFPKPILHGLCTYGHATRAILQGLCGGEVKRFRAFKARFSEVVFPGDTLTTEGWQIQQGRYIIRVRTERAVVINNAYAMVAP